MIPHQKRWGQFAGLLETQRGEKVSQERLATLLSIDAETIAQWERGNKHPGKEMFEALCVALRAYNCFSEEVEEEKLIQVYQQSFIRNEQFKQIMQKILLRTELTIAELVRRLNLRSSGLRMSRSALSNCLNGQARPRKENLQELLAIFREMEAIGVEEERLVWEIWRNWDSPERVSIGEVTSDQLLIRDLMDGLQTLQDLMGERTQSPDMLLHSLQSQISYLEDGFGILREHVESHMQSLENPDKQVESSSEP